MTVVSSSFVTVTSPLVGLIANADGSRGSRDTHAQPERASPLGSLARIRPTTVPAGVSSGTSSFRVEMTGGSLTGLQRGREHTKQRRMNRVSDRKRRGMCAHFALCVLLNELGSVLQQTHVTRMRMLQLLVWLPNPRELPSFVTVTAKVAPAHVAYCSTCSVEICPVQLSICT